jgi:HD-GYP domain-containing protein (c-di-GMP phosphodiesterase class II)
VDRTELLARVGSLLKLKQRTDELERAESVLFSLARSIEGKDPSTHGHCERLAEYSARLGEQLGLSEDQIIALHRAGVVHDVGKIAVPDAILLKPGPLTPDEWTVSPASTCCSDSGVVQYGYFIGIGKHKEKQADRLSDINGGFVYGRDGGR